MTKPKLTKAQQEVYDHMSQGHKAYYMSGFDAYWFVADMRGKKTRQVDKLLELGLIRITKRRGFGYPSVAEVSE